MKITNLDLVDAKTGEMHLPFMNYCGPGTRLDIKLNEDKSPKPGFEPVDRVDEAALKHDIAYKNRNFRARHEADKVIINEVLNIPNPTARERCESCIVIAIMFIKKMIDSAIITIIDYFASRE